MRMGKIAAAAATAAFGACAFAGPAGADNFVNATPITVSDNASASPYPSPISVSGFCGGSVTFAAVGLNGFSHTDPRDVDMLLVAPGGQRTMLMSDAGDGQAANNVSFFFTTNPTATSPISVAPTPISGAFTQGAFYSATDVNTGPDTFAAPAPAGPYSSSMGTFMGVPPVGTWQLFVLDDSAGDSGSFAGGWQLTLQTDTPSFVGEDDADSGCGGSGGGSGGGSQPSLSSLALSPKVFRAAKSGASVVAAALPRPPVGAKLSFGLTRRIGVGFTVQRWARGRKVGTRCVRATRSNRGKPSCRRLVAVKGSFSVAAAKTRIGKNTVRFRGRVGGKRLTPGSYRLTARARGEGKPLRTAFRIVR